MSNEKQLLRAFEAFRNALMECDQETLMESISEEYQGFSLNGTVERKEDILQAYTPGTIRLSKYDVEEMKCEVSADLGIITGKGSIEGSFGEFEFQHEVLFTDIFKWINQRWVYHKSQVTEIRPA
jgi:hypothetical protein